MKTIQKGYRSIYLIPFICVFLTGCHGKPDLNTLGLRTDEERETEDALSDFSAGTDQTVLNDFSAGTDQAAQSDFSAGTDQTALSGFSVGTDQAAADGGVLNLSGGSAVEVPELAVFVCGAVENPGVYRMPEGARIYEAVEAAGGFSAEADRNWLNLAELLVDGEKLLIPTEEEAEQLRRDGMSEEAAAGRDAPGYSDGKVNLNTATLEELMTLPGIGEAKANAVLRYRQEHGRFQSTEEIMQIRGIKEAVFSKVRDRITV